MKKSLTPSFVIYSIIAVTITTISIIYYRHEKMCEQNILNCQKISIGMSLQAVTRIMGEPRDINILSMMSNGQIIRTTQYCYDAPADAKKGVFVYINAAADSVILTECKE